MFLGMRGTGDWVADQRPKSWREQILYLYPNGMAPLTAIMSMMGSESVNDPEFNWWTQTQTIVSGAVSNIYTDAALSTAYTSGGVAGDVVYTVVTNTLGVRIRAGHVILFMDDSAPDMTCVGKVTDVIQGTTNSTLTVKLLEDDDNGATTDLSDCDAFKIIGNANPEGSEMPDAIALDPTKVNNYTQIFRTPLSITRTARKTKLRTGDQYQKAKAEALEMHSWEMELAFIFGIATENTGTNGKPERTTGGVIEFIKTYASANVLDFADESATWANGGETWLKESFEQIFRYGASEKLMLCGSGALLGIDLAASAGGTFNLAAGQRAYGMKIVEWITPFGVIYVKTHPMFSMDANTRNMALILEPSELTYRYIDDTAFYGESQSKSHPSGYGGRRIDGTNEEFLTECGLEFGLAQKCALLHNVGVDGA